MKLFKALVRGALIGLVAGGVVTACTVINLNRDELLGVRKHLQNSVLRITNQYSHSRGTGFIVKISGENVLITNAHVCDTPPYSLTAENTVDGNEYILKVAIISPQNDLCLLNISAGNQLPSLALANLEPEKGSTIYTSGYPLARYLRVTPGRLEFYTPIHMQLKPEFCFMLGICEADLPSFLTDFFVLPGQSGSPVINLEGEVVGVIYASELDAQTGYAIRLKALKSLIDHYQIRKLNAKPKEEQMEQ